MTCTRCATPIAVDVRFCTRCGAPNIFTQPLFRDRVKSHLQPLGILWLIYAGLRATKGAVGLAFLHHFVDDHSFMFFPIWPMAGIALGIGVIGALITGFALLTRQPWGRVIAIVFGIFALLHPISGTALGIYTLWVLAPRTSGYSYDGETSQRQVM